MGVKGVKFKPKKEGRILNAVTKEGAWSTYISALQGLFKTQAQLEVGLHIMIQHKTQYVPPSWQG